MDRFNHFEIILTIIAIGAVAFFFERLNEPSGLTGTQHHSAPRVESVPTARASQPISPSRTLQVQEQRPIGRTAQSAGRRVDLSSVPLPIDDVAAAAITRAIREPVPGEAFAADAEITSGMLAVAKMKSSWRLVKVKVVHAGGDVSIHSLGSEMPETRVTRDALRQIDSSVLPHVARSGLNVTATDDLPLGIILEALRPGLRWRSVSVLRVEANDEVAIHYINWSRSWDEIVPRSNLRFPTGATVD